MINEVVMNITYKINNDMEEFIVRSVQEYGMNQTIVVNPKKICEAIEKQTPKKPMIAKDRNGRSRDCPACNGHLPIQHFRYCPHCGQLVDWSFG